MVGLVTRRVNERRAFGVKVLSLEGYVCKFFCVCMYVCMYIYRHRLYREFGVDRIAVFNSTQRLKSSVQSPLLKTLPSSLTTLN